MTLVLLASVFLAACGGGGGGSTASLTPSAPTSAPTGVPTTAPTTAPSSSPQAATITGKVVQLAGPLSSSTWNLAAPSGCPAPQTNSPCTTYPTPIPSPLLPTAASTPGVGPGIGGVHIYVTTLQGAVVNGIPQSPIASATTSPNGTFSISIPVSSMPTSAPNGVSVGLLAINGTSISSSTGTSNLGYTIAHADAQPGTAVTLYIDTLDGDKQSAFAWVNSFLASNDQPPIVADTVSQAVARLTVGINALLPSSTQYEAFGGAQDVAIEPSNGPGAFWGAGIPGDTPQQVGIPLGVVYGGMAAMYESPYTPNNPGAKIMLAPGT